MSEYKKGGDEGRKAPVDGRNFSLSHGDVVIAAITSCTNTSNPSVLIAAGLLARNALAKGLRSKPWVKTSLAPGSQVVAEYLEKAGLQKDLDALGFNLVGFGCTTCIGNSGPLPAEISKAINDNNMIAASVLSATATSRDASRRMCRRTTSPRPRSWWPMRSPARSRRTSQGAARRGCGRQARLPQGHLALLEGDPGIHRQVCDA